VADARWITGDTKKALIALSIFIYSDNGGHDAVQRTLGDVLKRE